MIYLLVAGVALLSFANGTNDNFKGVATLWGAGRTGYGRALAWGTASTALGSLLAIWFARGLVARFNGSGLVAPEIYTGLPFLGAVAIGAAATVLLASRLGLPVSTTHALTGALVGASTLAAGWNQVHLAALGKGVVLPLLFSPLAALALTVTIVPGVTWFVRRRDCVCVEEPAAVATSPNGVLRAAVAAPPAVRWAGATECNSSAEATRWSFSDALHWFSGGAISFARGLNDTPKIAAVLLAASAGRAQMVYVAVALAIALGGVIGSARVANMLSKQITPMGTEEAVSANLVAAGLVTLASLWALPVSTTHVTSGGIFGIGLLRRGEADWRRVRDILLSWIATLPLGAALAAVFYALLSR